MWQGRRKQDRLHFGGYDTVQGITIVRDEVIEKCWNAELGVLRSAPRSCVTVSSLGRWTVLCSPLSQPRQTTRLRILKKPTLAVRQHICVLENPFALIIPFPRRSLWVFARRLWALKIPFPPAPLSPSGNGKTDYSHSNLTFHKCLSPGAVAWHQNFIRVNGVY